MSPAKEGRDRGIRIEHPYDSFVLPSQPVHQDVAGHCQLQMSQEMNQHLLTWGRNARGNREKVSWKKLKQTQLFWFSSTISVLKIGSNLELWIMLILFLVQLILRKLGRNVMS